MMYQMYQAQCDVAAPLQAMAKIATSSLKHPASGLFDNFVSARFGAAYEMLARSGLTHTRPAFGIDSVEIGGGPVAVREERVHVTPFATLLRFAKDAAAAQPRVLLVAPLSGHFATLLRSTVRTMLPEHDVYITDWHNARDVPVDGGRFDVDDYIDHVIRFLEIVGHGRPRRRRLPALRARARRGRRHGRSRKRRATAQHDAHGRSHRCPPEPDESQCARDEQAARVVRA
jgi:poly(3-hydroxybutyrate) depolymerase